jgi:hypothetical protein
MNLGQMYYIIQRERGQRLETKISPTQTIDHLAHEEMFQVKTTLENSGLKKVICHTSGGYIR